MANPVVFSNGFFAISTSSGTAASTNFGNVIEAQLPIALEELADNVFGDSARGTYPGVQTGDAITVKLKQDFTAASIDSKLWAIFNGRLKRNYKFRAVNSAVSTANPSYLCAAYITKYAPLGSGKFGDKVDVDITIKIASGSSVTRSTST
jgi:hypothetical protein